MAINKENVLNRTFTQSVYITNILTVPKILISLIFILTGKIFIGGFISETICQTVLNLNKFQV